MSSTQTTHEGLFGSLEGIANCGFKGGKDTIVRLWYVLYLSLTNICRFNCFEQFKRRCQTDPSVELPQSPNDLELVTFSDIIRFVSSRLTLC